MKPFHVFLLFEILAYAALEIHYIAELWRWHCCERVPGSLTSPPRRQFNRYIGTAIVIAAIVGFGSQV